MQFYNYLNYYYVYINRWLSQFICISNQLTTPIPNSKTL